MTGYRWDRLAAIVGATALGLTGSYMALASDAAPKWAIAVSGILLIVGVAGALALAILLWSVITDDIRPSLRCRKPVVPMALSHRESALIGKARFRQHPIRFWAGLTLNTRFFVGVMVFEKPEYLEFSHQDAPNPSQHTPENHHDR